MDGQMARYRKSSSLAGCFFDKLTDQIQVTLWFAAVGYAAYAQSQKVLRSLSFCVAAVSTNTIKTPMGDKS